MVGHGEVHVAIVVDVAEVRRPALLEEDEAAVGRLFGPPSLAVIDPELVDATRVLRVTDELSALGDVQIDVAIAVEVAEHGAVVAAVVGVRIVAVVVAHQRHQALIVDGNAGLGPLPHAAEGVVVASEGVEDTVVVEVGHVAGLHEHGAIVEIVELEGAPGADGHEVDSIVAATGVDVLEAIVVHVANAGAPLVRGADLTVVDLAESGGGLVENVDVVTLVEEHEVVQSIVVDIDEADRASAVKGVAEQVGGQGEGLGECGDAEQQHGSQRGKAGLVHP